MNTAIANTNNFSHSQRLKPSFIGLVRGEIFKLRHMWTTWIWLALLLMAICGPFFILLSLENTIDFSNLSTDAVIDELKNVSAITLTVIRIFLGFFIIFATANAIGREYQLGTVRILLSRGVGKLQLLLAKITGVILFSLFALLLSLIVGVIMLAIYILFESGNLEPLTVLNQDFWNFVGMHLLVILISAGVTLLMTAAFTVIGRSLVFGLSIGLAFFPADNIIPTIFQLVNIMTGQEFWLQITHYMLGPIINYLPAAWVPGSDFIGASPLLSIEDMMAGKQATTLEHSLIVIAVYAIIFTAISLFLTWKRDVTE